MLNPLRASAPDPTLRLDPPCAGLEALAGLQCLAQLDLTCCRGISDEAARAVLPRLTRANIQARAALRPLCFARSARG